MKADAGKRKIFDAVDLLFVFTFLSSSYTPKVRIPLSYETVC